MARHFAGNPIGQRIDRRRCAYEVVGVARDTPIREFKDAPRDVVYLPFFPAAKNRVLADLRGPPTRDRRADDRSAGPRSRGRVDPGLTCSKIKTLEAQTEESLSRERLLALLTATSAGLRCCWRASVSTG